MGGAATLGFSTLGFSTSVDWYRTVGVKALGDVERKVGVERRAEEEIDEDAAELNDENCCLLDAAERHREESNLMDVAIVHKIGRAHV